jgi:hypothetical protein
VAVIRSPSEGLFRSVEKLKRQVIERAARLGADAVVLSFWGAAGGADATGVTSSGEVVFVAGEGAKLHVVGRAIRYTDTPPPDPR